MKNLKTLLLCLPPAVAMAALAKATEHMQPVHALATLISELCFCVAGATWCFTSIYYKKKHGLSNR